MKMKFFFLLSLFLTAYPVFIYPSILFFLGLFKNKAIKKDENLFPYTSLIISAYNEEKIIREKIKNALELYYPKEKLEIIVASESNDKTNTIVQEYERDGVLLYSYEKRQGKTAVLYQTVPDARGDIIVFSDADVMYQKDAIKKLVRNFADSSIGVVSGRLVYINPQGTIAGEGEGVYWNYEMLLKRLSSKISSVIGASGSIYAIRKELYFPLDMNRGDDFEIPAMIAIKGYRSILEEEALAYAEASDSSEDEFKRKVRIVSWFIKSGLILIKKAVKNKRWLIVFQILSHKFSRWFMPIWLILLLISNLLLFNTGLLLKYFFIMQISFYLIALYGGVCERRNINIKPVLSIPYFFVVVNYATFCGIWKSITGTGERVTWEKTR